MTGTDTSSFFTTHQTRDVPRDQWGRYKLPGPDGTEESWTRATTFAATLAEQYGLRIWKERQVVWGLSRRPDLLTMASTISGPEDKKALGAIVDEAHVAAGTQAKANRGTAIHRACQAAERGAWDQVPAELRPHVTKYLKAMADGGLQILPSMVERTVIVNRYKVAGTFDNLVMCPDGRIRVADKKTGSLDYADIEFAIQLGLYANADAIFDYDTGRYEPMPEVAKDYAVIAHIDPETGHTELQRANIEWGWVWARTCAEVMDIRKTKHVITPYIPPVTDGMDSQMMTPAQQTRQPIQKESGYERIIADVTSLPEVPVVVHAFDQNGSPIPAVAGGFVNAASSVNPEYQAFWSDSRHDLEPDTEDAVTMNGVPLEQYGQPNTWPCARGESCETTGTDGLHTDGTVCLYGNARPRPIADLHTAQSSIEITGQSDVVVEDLGPVIDDQAEVPSAESPFVATTPQESNVDEIIARLDKLKTKAMVQQVARKLMARVGIKEGSPGSIKLSTYKVNIAKAVVSMAFEHKTAIPGLEDGDPDFGTPTGPAPAEDKTDTAVQPKSEQAAAILREDQIRVAVESIRQQRSIAGLNERHTYYSGTSIGWTDEMQDAARTRAAELEESAGEQALTPMQMIQGATSRETLSKAWAKATDDGKNMDAWNTPGPNGAPSLNQAAMAKDAELAQKASVAPSGN
jgi:hypothetical protein